MRNLRSLLATLLGATAMCLNFGTAIAACAANSPFVPVSANVQARQLGRGMNVMSVDPYWKDGTQSRFKFQYFSMLKATGFSTVRIPQALYDHRSPSGDLDQTWISRLDAVTSAATAAGLNVIIDNNSDATCVKLAAECLSINAALWGQLAEHYSSAPNSVIFELYNEPNNALTPDVWNAGIPGLLAAVRRSNPTRNVIIGPSPSNDLKGLPNLALPASDQHIIVTIHYYAPFKFTHQGAPFLPEATRPPLGRAFNPALDAMSIDADFNMISAWASSHGRPIIIGEFGTYDLANMDDRAAWTSKVARTAEAHGFSWIYWQFDKSFYAYNIDQNAWVEPIINALIPEK